MMLRYGPIFLLALVQSACVFGTNNGGNDAGNDSASPTDAASDTGSSADARDAAPGIDATCFADAGDVLALHDYDAGDPYYPDATTGTQDRLQFVFDSGELFSTFPFRPMLAGTREILVGFRNDLVPRLSPSIADPGIVATTGLTISRVCCTDSDAGASCSALPDMPSACMGCSGRAYSFVNVAISATNVGDTTLTLRTDDGAMYESIALSVRAAATLRTFQGDPGTEVTTLTAATTDVLRLRTYAYASDGTQLEGRFGITQGAMNGSLATVRTHTTGFGNFGPAPVDSYDVDVYAAAAGDTSWSIIANQAQLTLPLHIQ